MAITVDGLAALLSLQHATTAEDAARTALTCQEQLVIDALRRGIDIGRRLERAKAEALISSCVPRPHQGMGARPTGDPGVVAERPRDLPGTGTDACPANLGADGWEEHAERVSGLTASETGRAPLSGASASLPTGGGPGTNMPSAAAQGEDPGLDHEEAPALVAASRGHDHYAREAK